MSEFTLTLANDTEVTCIGYKKYSEHIQGAQRNVIELWIDAEGKTFDDVDALFTPANTSRMQNSADDGELVYEDYTIRAGIARAPKEDEGERYEVKLAQLTFSEQKLLQHENEIADLWYEFMTGGAS